MSERLNLTPLAEAGSSREKVLKQIVDNFDQSPIEFQNTVAGIMIRKMS